MAKALFHKVTGLYAGKYAKHGDIVHNAQSHRVVEVDAEPDLVMDRWDGANGVRPSTGQERLDQAEGRRDARADAVLAGGSAMSRAIIKWVANLHGIPLPTAEAQIKVLYKDMVP
jgi:hypothetical protein